MEVLRPWESKTDTLAVPTLSPSRDTLAPVTEADTTALLLLLAAYGPTPPPMAKDRGVPLASVRVAGEVV